MKLGNEMYCNTGGNCMVMYVNVFDGGEVKQFACTDEMIGAFDGADMADEEIELWWVEGYEQLVYRVGEDIANQLQERFLKHESDAQWFKEGSKRHYHVKEHPYFLSEVEITIEPFEKCNFTSCELRFKPNGQDGGIDFEQTWWVDTHKYIDNAKDALEELAQDKYQYEGTSEA